jgi:hypothetical protein
MWSRDAAAHHGRGIGRIALCTGRSGSEMGASCRRGRWAHQGQAVPHPYDPGPTIRCVREWACLRTVLSVFWPVLQCYQHRIRAAALSGGGSSTCRVATGTWPMANQRLSIAPTLSTCGETAAKCGGCSCDRGRAGQAAVRGAVRGVRDAADTRSQSTWPALSQLPENELSCALRIPAATAVKPQLSRGHWIESTRSRYSRAHSSPLHASFCLGICIVLCFFAFLVVALGHRQTAGRDKPPRRGAPRHLCGAWLAPALFC